VRVDGKVVQEPMERVRDDQAVELDPKARLEPLASMTLIWHKPANRVLPDEPLLPDALAHREFNRMHMVI
jgi:23S rRNA pseudouridine2604 synthase